MRVTRRREDSSKPQSSFLEIIIMRSFARKITDYAVGSLRVCNSGASGASAMSSHDRRRHCCDGDEFKSPSLVVTSSVENAVFSQYAGNNTPLWRRGRGRGLDLHKRIIPTRRKAIPIHASTPSRKHSLTCTKTMQLPCFGSIVSLLSLKAVFYADLFFVDETERQVFSSVSQPPFFIA